MGGGKQSQSGIATAGTAESYLKSTHLSRTRRVHQVSAAALYMCNKKAHNAYQDHQKETDSFEDSCKRKMETVLQFKFWATLLELLNVLVGSMRESNFHMYLNILSAISPWFFTMDYTNYLRWLPVHFLRGIHIFMSNF